MSAATIRTRIRPVSGHVFLRKGKRGSIWYAKFRLPDGHQIQRRIGPAWKDKRRPAEGYFTKRTAQTYLDDVLAEARRGTVPGLVRTHTTFAEAANEWLIYSQQVRDCKPSTLRDYRNMVRVLKRDFANREVGEITPEELETWLTRRQNSNRTLQKYRFVLGAIFKRAMKLYGLPRNPIDTVERPRVRRAVKIDVLRPEEVQALVRAAESEQDAALFHTAAFAGLRMGELLALRWRDIDFKRSTIHVRENWTQGQTTTPKGGAERAVPMAEEVAQRLARLGGRLDRPEDLDDPLSGRLPKIPEWGLESEPDVDGSTQKLCRLRYVGSAHRWQFAIYRASNDDYQDSLFPTGLPAGTCEEALDTACGLYLNDPTAWT